MATMRKLIEERDYYLVHDENSVLQNRALESIARSMLEVSSKMGNLTDEESKAVEWAKKQLGN